MPTQGAVVPGQNMPVLPAVAVVAATATPSVAPAVAPAGPSLGGEETGAVCQRSRIS